MLLLGMSVVCYHHKCKGGIIIFIKLALAFPVVVNS